MARTLLREVRSLLEADHPEARSPLLAREPWPNRRPSWGVDGLTSRWGDDRLFASVMASQRPVQGAPSGGFWDFDEPLPTLSRRMTRAVVVAAAWALSLLPVALGWQRCALATICHLPCPGCGMTRAIKLLAAGRFGASLRMHPLAVPILVAGTLLVGSTVWATLVVGSPVRLHRSLFGQGAIAAAIVVYVAAFALWVLRFLGYFGGPVPVW